MTTSLRQKPPTLADVAKRAGVSRSLVSLAIRGEGYVRAESREKILKAVQELNYVPNFAARTLASARSSYVGTLVGDVTNPLQAEIAKWVTVLTAENGRGALLSIDAGTDQKAEQAIESLMSLRVPSAILIGAPYEKVAIARVAERLPSVYIGRLLKVVDIDSVTTDHILGANIAVDHLVSVGCRRIVHLGGGASPGAQRMETGYREAMARHGLSEHAEVVRSAYSVDAGAMAGRALFARDRLPDAIFACSDLTAIGVLNEAVKHGISIPDQLCVMGYDDVTLSGSETLALSSIHQSARDLAEAGIKALERRLENPDAPREKVLVLPRLAVRRSTSRT
ncbi:MAG: LacI family DNA-binding transcriptional regulator [Rhizobiaceae bacterium]|nr:LacI family DNA-binding transcriptional regulator [Rhizobiaceae bacterium]